MLTLPSGKWLGPYEILAPIGAGGMGQVYKARDTRLDRAVAIKVLPPEVAGNTERRERFEREARAVASLNHAHICVLHDVGHQDGIDFLVMEFLEGESMAQRLERGPLPLEEALRYAVQIADALDKAHRQGITHRDLKPGNIMMTKSGAKLLDFGLAKLRDKEPLSLASAPTRSNLTNEGTILGTIQYMAPEQLEAGEIDARTDIFAFGATLYELISGRKAFEGKSQVSVMAAILEHEPPPLSMLQKMTPPALDRAVKKCLAKDPDQRWQSAADLADELRWLAESGTTAATPAQVVVARKSRQWIAWAIMAISIVAVATTAMFFFAPLEMPEAPLLRFSMSVPAGASIPQGRAESLSVSPDGRWLSFVAATPDGKILLWLRQQSSLESTPLPGTDGAVHPFWSPDSRYIGFFAQNKIKKVEIPAGRVETISDSRSTAGGAWNRDGIILFPSTNNSGLYRVSAAGGPTEPVTKIDAAMGEIGHSRPYFLPDGKHFLYLVSASDGRYIYIGSIDSPDRKRLFRSDSKAIFVEPGFLLFLRGETLFGQEFDLKRQELIGEAIQVASDVSIGVFAGAAAFSASNTGVLIHQSGVNVNASRFQWLDRTGKELSQFGEPANYDSFDLSTDGKQIATGKTQRQSGSKDIWIIEADRNTETRVTFDYANEGDPVWSPDGKQLVFSSSRPNSPRDIFLKMVGSTAEETPLHVPSFGGVEDWSKDGKFILFSCSGGQICALQMPEAKVIRVMQSPGAVDEEHFSYDSRWIAYNSDESGASEIYITPFPAAGQKIKVSTNGGYQPRWRRDGREIFYLAPDGKLMSVELKGTDSLQPGTPTVLFDTHLVPTFNVDQYAVSPDGQRFLIRTPVPGATSSPITVVVNWTSLFK